MASDTGATDEVLLARALAADADTAERTVFDHGRRLGESFRRFHGVTIELDELPALLAHLADSGAACLRGDCARVDGEDAVRLERAGCEGAADGRICDWWREAIGGLVLGVSGGLRHTRHRSRGHGADRCVDVVHADPESPLRFGPIPEELAPGLAAIARTVAIVDAAARVEFLGLSDHVLYYQLAGTGCGGGAVRGQPLVERGVRRRFPQLEPREVTPRPVLADH